MFSLAMPAEHFCLIHHFLRKTDLHGHPWRRKQGLVDGTFADVTGDTDQAPDHVGTVMTVGRLVKGFLDEKVSMAKLVHRGADAAVGSFAVGRRSAVDVQRLLDVGNLWAGHAS